MRVLALTDAGRRYAVDVEPLYFQIGRDPSKPRHYFLQAKPAPSDRPIVREISTRLLNRYAPNEKRSRKEFRSVTFQIPWWRETRDAQGTLSREHITSKPMTLHELEQHLRFNNAFRFEQFDLHDPGCPWLDDQMIIANEVRIVSDHGGPAGSIALPTKLGSAFPITPSISREGWGVSSFQRAVAKRVRDLWQRLVDRSDRFFDYEWLQDLRALVSECISLIDITLNQIYWKARYDPLPGWVFNPGRLGDPWGRKLVDKLKWPGQITGRFLHAHEERPGFLELKDLRNHLQHFDPRASHATSTKPRTG